MFPTIGIVGQETRKITEFTYPLWNGESLLIMHSDGLSARWDLKSYPALVQRDPSLIAGVLYRDCSRGRDDMTVLTVRESAVKQPPLFGNTPQKVSKSVAYRGTPTAGSHPPLFGRTSH